MKSPDGPSRSRFTVLRLLTVIAIIAVLSPLVILGLTYAKEAANRAKCASNLSALGKAMLLYANDNRGAFPRTGYRGGAAPTFDTTNTGSNASDPFDANNPFTGLNNIPSVWYLMARCEGITMGAFICPSSSGQQLIYPTGGIAQHCNFDALPGGGAVGNLTYSIQNPYANDTAIKDGWCWDDTVSADYVEAADLNPGAAPGCNIAALTPSSSSDAMRNANSFNHGRAGQNVLFGDGAVEFVPNAFVGVKGDCIYTQGGTRQTDATVGAHGQNLAVPKINSSPNTGGAGGINGSPNSKSDTVLLPQQY